MRLPWGEGKSLTELGYVPRKVIVYRALPAKNPVIKKGDYLTDNFRFAKGHAQHMAVTEEEDQAVVSAYLPSDQVVGAPNPGEYRYSGNSDFHGAKVLVFIKSP